MNLPLSFCASLSISVLYNYFGDVPSEPEAAFTSFVTGVSASAGVSFFLKKLVRFFFSGFFSVVVFVSFSVVVDCFCFFLNKEEIFSFMDLRSFVASFSFLVCCFCFLITSLPFLYFVSVAISPLL